MGQKEIENRKQNKMEKEENEINEEKDYHMIGILKKENEILKAQLRSLNLGKGNKEHNYDTLISMLEVLSMQRTKILSIKKGNFYYNLFYFDRKYKNDRRKKSFNEMFKR